MIFERKFFSEGLDDIYERLAILRICGVVPGKVNVDTSSAELPI